MQDACLEIDKFADDLKKRLEDTNEQLLFGVEKFTTRYGKLKDSIPLLTSSFHRFGWTFGGTITSQKGGHLRHGRRISVQATAAGRRKGTGLMSKGYLEDQSNPQRMKKGVTSVLDIFYPPEGHQRDDDHIPSKQM